MCRAARRAAEAGPRFPSGHWVVLKTLGLFCSVTVALVSPLSAAASETSDGGYHGAALVGVTSMVLALSETIVGDGAGKGCEIPNFKGSYLGRFPLVLADFWTSDHLSERSRRVCAFSGTQARGTLTLKRR